MVTGPILTQLSGKGAKPEGWREDIRFLKKLKMKR